MKIVCWWSGGVTSAVACKIAIDLFGVDECEFIMLDTRNEDDDTYRFKEDCEKWYGKEIAMLRNEEYESIEDVWDKYESLNVAHGAICSSELKRAVRIKYQKENPDIKNQIFGFDNEEPKRALAMRLNYPEANPMFLLLLYAYRKKDCIKILTDAGIQIPNSYKLGYHNNNCLKTGCVQGGLGYWQKYQIDFPDNFLKMAHREHRYTDSKGYPVTICKYQGKKRKDKYTPVFLLPHPDYPLVMDISMIRGRMPEPLTECNGFCGTNDLIKNRGSAKSS